ncbi:hypothetical protein [Maribacter luteus]|uniref:hypothetical protein n=1 Tax=Maribacter luteus TaxID=2594478 RepID=UPI00249280FC|nr:hypothetical protein [Maribacter luteus]
MTEKEKLKYLIESRRTDLQKRTKLYYRVGYFFIALMPISFVLNLFNLHPVLDFMFDQFGLNGVSLFFILIFGLGFYFLAQANKKEREIKELID